jgi:hypothetical protein
MCKVAQFGRVLGKSYISSDSQHVPNEKIYAIIRHDGIQLQVEKHSKAEKEKKYVQFVTFFHLLKLGKPITDFESMHGFLRFLKVKNTLDKHWTNINGWGMVECMNNVVLVVTKIAIQTTNYISVSCDEVTSVDN